MSDGPPRKPAILSTSTTQAFWSALERHELIVSRCHDCEHTFHYPRERCPACWGADVESMPASGRGTVWSGTVVHRAGHPAWQSETPFLVALVRLEEGPVVVTNIVGAGPTDALVGTAVEVEFRDSGSGVIAMFHPSLHRDDASGPPTSAEPGRP